MDAVAFPSRFRTVFLSDLHLGSRGCQAELVLDFLSTVDCATLYLVGDIVDGWRLSRGWFWPAAHDAVAQRVLQLARRGVRVVYVPGNHDEFAKRYCGLTFGGVEVLRDTVHVAADGRRYLVTHGDDFDGVVLRARWLALFGDWAYRALLRANTLWNICRRRMGLGYWSFAAFLKGHVRQASAFVDDFERALARAARERGCEGVVCGHIHHPALRDIDGVRYVNDGDWVESCTAAVEHACGRMEILHWGREPAMVQEARRAGAEAASV